MKKSKASCLQTFLALALFAAGSAPAELVGHGGALQEIRIGALNIRTPEQTLLTWQPTADYLSQALAGYRFKIVPLDSAQFDDAVARDRLDFILTNPAQYVFLEAKHHVARIATLVNKSGSRPLKEFGGVIIVRDSRSDLRTISDLKGARIAAVGPEWLGAYQVQAAEALAVGIDVHRQAQLFFTGEPQDKVVIEVLEGRADVGFVRTGLLEEIAGEGGLDVSALRLISPRQAPGFPLKVSTQLYPEWPFAIAPRVPDELAGRVAIALLSMPPDSEAALKGRYSGWTIPADYHRIHELMRTLHLPPYDQRPLFSLRDVWRRYDVVLFAGFNLLLLAAGLMVLRFRSLGRKVALQMEKIGKHTDELETEVAARREAEQGLRLSASVFENSHDGILIADHNSHVIDVNRSFSEITGYSREEIVGKNPRVLQSGRHDKAFYQELWKSINQRGHWCGEIWNRRKSGEFYLEFLDITAIRNPEGDISHYVAVFSDITDLRDSQERLKLMAHYDPLTHLPNRSLLADRLNQNVAQAQRNDSLLAVCFLDLDGFKPINDDYGHDSGDLLLISIARRLESTLRVIDTVARFGGDEFVLLLPDLADMDELEAILARVMDAIGQPVLVDQNALRVTASIGLTIYPADDADPESLMRHADQAMYVAKREGRGRYSLFDAGWEKEVQSNIHRIEHLREAIRQGEMVLHYQPKVDMRQGHVIGLEALIRWQHPKRGLLPPCEFLPLAEESNLIVEIDEWVIDDVLRQLEVWIDEGLSIPVSVNVSARKLQAPDFAESVARLLARHEKVSPRLLEFEILESAALDDIAGIHQTILACQRLGITFALDDFGTGYSSLSYLKRLPADMIKIDQSFVRDLLDNPEDLAIVEGIVGLAKIFRRNVVSEGVESTEQGVMLMRLGCDLAQGYSIARPMPASDVRQWCRNFMPDPSWAEWADVAWKLDDFPLLAAQGDHVKWVRNLSRLVEGAAGHVGSDAIADHYGCRFGNWYYGAGTQRYGSVAEFRSIEPIHAEVHRIGGEIVSLVERGEMGLAHERLERLLQLRDEVVDHLTRLQRAVSRYWQ